MFGIGAPELIIVLIIVLVLFGGRKIPELSRSIGESIRQFKNGINGEDKPKEKTTEDKSTDKSKSKTTKKA